MVKVKDLSDLQGGFPFGRIYYQIGNDKVELTYSTTMERWKDYYSTITFTDKELDELEVIEMTSYAASLGRINITVQ